MASLTLTKLGRGTGQHFDTKSCVRDCLKNREQRCRPQARLLGKTQKPLVVVNAMGGMEELSKFGSAQHLNEVMGKWEAMPYQERKDERNRMNVAGGAMTATKFSKSVPPRGLAACLQQYLRRAGPCRATPRHTAPRRLARGLTPPRCVPPCRSRLFSYWDNNMKWLGKGNTAGSGIGVPNQASWHYWRPVTRLRPAARGCTPCHHERSRDGQDLVYKSAGKSIWGSKHDLAAAVVCWH